MAWQLIYTSAPRGLLSGQSGFCTVARSGDLREALVQRLEQISSYHYLRVAEAATANRNPTICAFRILDLRGTKYHVLTRIQPCGLDFTSRTNHLAHHLVFQAGELAQLPSPAVILRYWEGWMTSWQGEPRLLADPALESFGAAGRTCLPAQTWMRMTGDAGRAVGLLESECIRGCYLVCPPGGEEAVLEMFCETLELKNPNGQYALRAWVHPFTTFLQAEDDAADFQWRACQEGTPGYQQAVQRSAPLLALASVRVPSNSLVKTAREGLKPPAPSSVAVGSRLLPAAGRRPAPLPITTPSRQPTSRRRSSKLSLIRAYAATKLRLSLMQQWFSNQSAPSRASIGIFAAVLLVLMAKYMEIHYWQLIPKPPAASNSPPKTLPAQAPVAPTAPTGTPGGPPAGQSPSSNAVSAQPEPPDLRQLDWLSGEGQTFVFATSSFTRFELPVDFISPFQILINKFENVDKHMLPTNIHLSVNTNAWDFQSGARMTVNVREGQELSAQAASGLKCSFNYSDWISTKTNPVVVQTTFATPLKALSFSFDFSPASNGTPFRLLIVNESNPPAAVHFSARWLTTNGTSIAASLQAPLSERLLGKFTLLQGQQWQLRPFIKAEQQTNYLYTNWPASDLPLAGQDLDFARVKKRLTAREETFKRRAAISDRKLGQLTKVGDYPLGKDLRLTNSLASFPTWTNAPPTRALFLKYLNELRKQGTTNNDWVKEPFKSQFVDEDDATREGRFETLYNLWIQNVPDAANNPDFGAGNYFSATWQKLNELENTRQEKERVQGEIDKVRERVKLVPGTLEEAAYVGLFIVDPRQPRRGLEMIRFDGP